MKNPFPPDSQGGSIALEYVLISAFTALVSLAAVAYVSEIIKSKISQVEEKIGVKFNDDLDLFDTQ